MAQREHFAYEIRVVELSQVSAGLIRRTRHIGPVKGVAQCGVVRELHDRQITGHLEAELVAFPFLRLCRQQSSVAHVFGYTVEFGRTGVIRKLVGGVERVFAEFLAQFGLAFLNRGKPFTGCALQFRAAQHEVAQRVFVCLALFGIKRRRVDGLVFGIQALVRAQAGPELGYLGQGFVVYGTQLGGIGHAVEMAHGTPGAAEFLGRNVEHCGDTVPYGRECRSGHGIERSVAVGQ